MCLYRSFSRFTFEKFSPKSEVVFYHVHCGQFHLDADFFPPLATAIHPSNFAKALFTFILRNRSLSSKLTNSPWTTSEDVSCFPSGPVRHQLDGCTHLSILTRNNQQLFLFYPSAFLYFKVSLIIEPELIGNPLPNFIGSGIWVLMIYGFGIRVW